jgi:hypothetical protein
LQDLQNNRYKELFLNRKVRGPDPRAMDSVRVTHSTMDRRQHGQKDARAQRCAHQSLASGHSGAQELIDEGAKVRGEHREPISGLTGARSVVWWPGNGKEVAVEGKLSGCGA